MNWVETHWMKALTIRAMLEEYRRVVSAYPKKTRGPYCILHKDTIEYSICGFGASRYDKNEYSKWDASEKELLRMCELVMKFYDVDALPSPNKTSIIIKEASTNNGNQSTRNRTT